MKSPRPALSVLSALVLPLLVAACSSAPPPPSAPAAPPPLPPLAGTYSGTLSVDGQPLSGTLRIEAQGAAHTFIFSFPEVGLTATGSGGPTDATSWRAEVPYAMTCPGTAQFTGRMEEDGRLLVGSFETVDCDGTMRGTFRFTRQG